ncbi:hypothetical protein D3C87_2150270 [compost metagenome]
MLPNVNSISTDVVGSYISFADNAVPEKKRLVASNNVDFPALFSPIIQVNAEGSKLSLLTPR